MKVHHQKQENVKQNQKHKALQKPSAAAADQSLPQQDQGLYELVKQDQLLRAYHTAKLRNTPGYDHISDEVAANMVDQMLSLVTLLCEMAMG